MQIEVDWAGGSVSFAGSLDARHVAAARETLHGLLDRTPAVRDVVVDVSGVEMIDAVGLGMLVSAHRHAVRQGSRLVLRGAPPPFMRVLAVTRLTRVLHLERHAEAW